MAIKRLGAQRFAGLAADVASLPIDPDLVGAIFDATDTIQKFVFDGTVWQEFVSATGEDNTGANVGVGTGTIFRNKIGVVLNFKSLIGGDNITVTDNADDITITSTGTSPLTTKGDLYGFNTVDDRIPVGTDGQVLSANSANPIGVEWIDDITKTFQPGYQFAATGIADLEIELIGNVWRLPIEFTNLALMTAYVETAPVGSDIIIIVQHNDSTNATITIPDGALTGSTTNFNFSNILPTDRINVDVTQVGSTTPGANLKISIIDGVQSNTKSIQFAVTSTGADVSTGVQPDVWRTPTSINTITEISAYVQVSPVGASLIAEVKKDGVTEGTVTILAGENEGTTSILTSGTLEFSNEITVDVTQVGSSTPGQNLKVSIIGN